MKFKFIFLLFFVYSCSSTYTKIDNRKPYNTKGFAYIYNEQDYLNKIITGKLNNEQLQISHHSLKLNSFIKITNPKTQDTLTLKNVKKIKFPEFYKILISKSVAEKLKLDPQLPLVEIYEVKKNKSFVAKKAKIFNEEKKISSKAPVANVEISNISKDQTKKKEIKKNDIFIEIATFYSRDSAEFLKKRITKEIPNFASKKLKIKKKTNNKINLISGPYNTINLMKNDYILLKKFGFEELEATLNE